MRKLQLDVVNSKNMGLTFASFLYIIINERVNMELTFQD